MFYNLQNESNQYRIKSNIFILYYNERTLFMNLYNKKFRKIVSIVVLAVVAAMLLTMIIPYLA